MKVKSLSLGMQGSVVLWIFFVLLLAMAIGVILLLPSYIVENHSDEQLTEVRRMNPGAENEAQKDDQEATEYKKQAKAYRKQFLENKSRLEVQGVTHWGKVDFEKILDRAGQADVMLQMQQEKKAIVVYESAIAELEQLQASKNHRFQSALTSGGKALEEENGDQARKQFELALSIEADDIRAKNGMKRAQVVEKVSTLLKSGNKKEEEGQLIDALEDYKKAGLLDPENARVVVAQTNVELAIAEAKFNNAMTQGFSALKKNKYVKARNSFLVARGIKPNSVVVGDALKLVDSEYKTVQIKAYQLKANGFEKEERWREAVKMHQSTLDLDPFLDFAIEGKKRSQFFLKLNNEMDYIVNHPERLSSEQPYNKAQKLLTKAESQQLKGPGLKRKIAEIRKIIEVSRIAIPVILESDGQTDIVVYKVGKLGRFVRRKLDLYPGKYTAVGSCPGYQDTRKEFAVTAGDKRTESVFIRCEEVI